MPASRPPPLPPPLPPLGAPARKKTSPVVWILIGVGIMLATMIAIAVLSVTVFMVTASRIPTNEAAAIQKIRAIQTAQVQHMSKFGKYASTLEELGPPGGAQRGAMASGPIENGYRFLLLGAANGYSISANPTAYGITGRRSFFADRTLAIHQNLGPESATADSEEVR